MEFDSQGYSKDAFCIPDHYLDAIDKVLVPHGMVRDRITKIANDIFQDLVREGERDFGAFLVARWQF